MPPRGRLSGAAGELEALGRYRADEVERSLVAEARPWER